MAKVVKIIDQHMKMVEQKLVRYVKQIKKKSVCIVEDVIVIGEMLTDAKRAIEEKKVRTTWKGWLRDNFEWTDETARNYINLFNAKEKLSPNTFGLLPLGDLYIL